MDTLTSETFDSSGLTIFQPSRGHRYGRESIALAAFADGCEGRRVCELGSGVGVVALQIAAMQKPSSVTAVEIQESLHAVALKNVRVNSLEGMVKCVNDDVRRFAPAHAAAFEVVVANPPFFGAAEGRLSPDAVRATARHELNGTLADFIQAARTLLVAGGRFFLVFDKRRLDELSNAACECGFLGERLEVAEENVYLLAAFNLRT